MLVYCQNKICNDIHVPEKKMYKRRFEFLIIYLKLFFTSQKYNYYTIFLEARQNSDEDSWDWFYINSSNWYWTTEGLTLTINKWLSMETEGDRGTVSGWAVFLAMVVLKLTTLSSDGRIQALIIKRAKSAKYGVPHPL